MSNYIIEGNIDFYGELFKSLDDDSDDNDEINTCQITGLQLTDKAVIMECNHHFNYDALYKEICKQKFEFKTYDIHTLNKKDQDKFKQSKMNYFLKCPYCRNIQFSILPYYEELGLEKKYGINSLDKSLSNPMEYQYKSYNGPHYGADDYTFDSYGKTFKKGQCCQSVGSSGSTVVFCNSKYVTNVETSDIFYCHYHYKNGLKNYKMVERKKLLDLKIKQKAELQKQKDAILNEKQKLLDEKNAERLAKGLPLLKRLLVAKKPVANIVQESQPIVIGQYVPNTEDTNTNTGCKSILKTGPNKGKMCGVKIIDQNCLCKRHCVKDIV